MTLKHVLHDKNRHFHVRALGFGKRKILAQHPLSIVVRLVRAQHFQTQNTRVFTHTHTLVACIVWKEQRSTECEWRVEFRT